MKVKNIKDKKVVMKLIKNIFKTLAIIFLIVIPILLILYSMFIDFLGCYLMFNNNNPKLELLLAEDGLDSKRVKIIFLDITAGDDKHLTIMNKNLSIDDKWISADNNKLVEYIKTNGIDVYNTVTIINYIYIIIVAIIISFKKLLENADMFGKFEERDN